MKGQEPTLRKEHIKGVAIVYDQAFIRNIRLWCYGSSENNHSGLFANGRDENIFTSMKPGGWQGIGSPVPTGITKACAVTLDENTVMLIGGEGLYSQHFIFFVAYEWVK